MIKKKPVRGKDLTAVTFRSKAPKRTRSLQLLGEFNDWRSDRHPMKRRKDGTWSVTVRLPKDEQFQFRYLIDGEQWLTDEQSDGLALNELGDPNALIMT
ncbi:MAG: isoamylase early set domain-containing protein [Planctomycetota bacterium]|nr:isoamylase early set domain-containing protein [Planctomycetota bacterium]